MSSKKQVDQEIVDGWRKLGFYYSRDKVKNTWLLVGSKEGLLNFSRILREYVINPEKAGVSEHEHYGPYSYLKIMTWNKPIIDNNGIQGTLSDLKRLSVLVSKKFESQDVPSEFEIDKEYSNENQSILKFVLKEDKFDPASEDPHPYPWKKNDGKWL